MGAIRLGQTPGRVRNVMGMLRLYFKPSLGKPVFRKSGVLRRSLKVLERNKKVRAAPPAVKCKGLPWAEFTSCLSREMPK